MRIGFGYDAHRLVNNRKLMLGGVCIPFEKGLEGHSDADVLLHAIMDALLGAAGLGDIGRQFPDNLDEFKNISSCILLKRTWDMIKKLNFKIINIDCTVVAQSPRLLPYINDMEGSVSNILEIDIVDINIKATTEEYMGFTGTGEGMAAYAVCGIEKVNYETL